MKPCS